MIYSSLLTYRTRQPVLVVTIIIIIVFIEKRDKSCQIIESGNFKGQTGKRKGRWESWKVTRSCERSSKNVGCKDKGDSSGNGGIRIRTNGEFGKQLEGFWRGNLCQNDPDMYAVRVSKNFMKGARNVELCKANRLYSLASLGNLLLPGNREETNYNMISRAKFQ